MDESVFWGILGVLATLITFVVSIYIVLKHEKNARMERSKAAFNEILRTAYRNLVIEERVPSFKELERIISSKMFEHNISQGDLPTELDFLNFLYTKLFEDELIELKRKDKLLDKINEKIKKEMGKHAMEEVTQKSLFVGKNKVILVMALLSIGVGMITMLFPYQTGASKSMTGVSEIILSFITMVIALVFTQYALKRKIKEDEESSPIRLKVQEAQKFEEVILNEIKTTGAEVQYKPLKFSGSNNPKYLDFFVRFKNRKFGIEVLSFGNFIPISVLHRLKEIAEQIKKSDDRIVLILATKEKIQKNDELQAYLRNWDYLINESSLSTLKEIIKGKK